MNEYIAKMGKPLPNAKPSGKTAQSQEQYTKNDFRFCKAKLCNAQARLGSDFCGRHQNWGAFERIPDQLKVFKAQRDALAAQNIELVEGLAAIETACVVAQDEMTTQSKHKRTFESIKSIARALLAKVKP